MAGIEDLAARGGDLGIYTGTGIRLGVIFVAVNDLHLKQAHGKHAENQQDQREDPRRPTDAHMSAAWLLCHASLLSVNGTA